MKVSPVGGDAGPPARPPRWPWLLLAAALAWSALIRSPLILNAESHLDSDLAVDGITLRNAAGGHWRWHYPGTPHIGIAPVCLSMPQAWLFGVNARTLVSGGTVAHGLLMLGVFLLARRGFGPVAATAALVPLTFASTGVVWLSGRITGGHLTVAAWHAAALYGLLRCLESKRPRGCFALGLWCGLGLWLDAMFLATLAAFACVPTFKRYTLRDARSSLGLLAIFACGLAIGVLPRFAGNRLEPYDAYQEQFLPVTEPTLLAEHARILGLDALPRLVAGHRLPGFQTEPPTQAILGSTRGIPLGSAPWHTAPIPNPGALAVFATAVALVGCAASMVALAVVGCFSSDRHAVVARVALAAAVLVAILFVINRNIFNSDNYRYLVYYLVAWPLGFGILMNALSQRGAGGVAVATAAVLLTAALESRELASWYRGFGWIDARGRPVAVKLDDPALRWLESHREIESVSGDYWVVYRVDFLSGGRVAGIPFAIYPNRFPERAAALPGGRPSHLLTKPFGATQGAAIESALRDGGRVIAQTPSGLLVEWPLAPRPRLKDPRSDTVVAP